MAVEGLNQEAVLRVRAALEGFDSAIRAMRETQKFLEKTGLKGTDAWRQVSKAAKSTGDASSSAGKKGKKAGEDIAQGAKKGLSAWEKLLKELKKADAAQRKFERGLITGKGGGIDATTYSPGKQDRLKEIRAAQAASSTKAIMAAEKTELAHTRAFFREQAELGKRHLAVEKAQNAEFARIRRERAEAARTLVAAEANAQMGALQRTVSSGVRERNLIGTTGDRTTMRSWDAQYAALERATGATARANAATNKHAGDLPRLRYALYDVSRTATVAALAIAGVGTAAIIASANYESAFTNVERTLDPGTVSVAGLRKELIGLSEDIPLAFGELSKIATLGNQLGISAESVGQFTETVARFSAVAGVSAEESAKAFGAMQHSLKVPASDFENLGSAIALVGRKSVATEPEILSLVREIGTQANQAGFAADEVVALAGTLGQLRVPPERARGSLTTYFQTLYGAVSEGGEKLEKFATITGLTSEKLAQMVRSGQGVEVLQRFTAGLANADGVVGATQALDELGLSQLRVSDVFQRLAGSADTFNNFLEIGAQGYSEGSELARQYAMVVDDLASKWQIFVNAFTTFGAAIGDAVAPALKLLLDMASSVIQAWTDIASHPVGKWFVGTAVVVAALAAALLGIVGVTALSVASFAALQTALVSLGWASATGGAKAFIAGMFGVAGASRAATAGVTVFKGALISTGIGAAIVLLGALATAFMTTGQSAEDTFSQYVSSTSGLAEAVAADTAAYQGAVAAGNTTLAGSFVELDAALDGNATSQESNRKQIEATAQLLDLMPPKLGSVNAALDENSQYLGKNATEWLRNALMQNEAFQQMAGNQDLADYMDAIGADMDKALLLGATQGKDALYQYLYDLQEAAIKSGKNISRVLQSASAGVLSGNIADKAIFGLASGEDQRALGTFARIIEGYGGALRLAGSQGTQAFEAIKGGAEESGAAFTDAADDLAGVGDTADEVAAKVYTLVDYASDLSGVMSRAFEIRYGPDQALDGITTGWEKVRSAADAARKAAEDHARTLATLGADRDIKAYWLSIAEMYGDEQRAAAIRAELAEIDAKRADEQKKLKDEQDKASMSLVGNSAAALANRANVLGMVGSYQEYLQALAASGVSQAELSAKAAQLKAEFLAQATQAGFSAQEIGLYSASFDDMKVAIDNVPRNITVDANIDPAIQALNEFVAKAAQAGTDAGSAIKRGIEEAFSGEAGASLGAGIGIQLGTGIAASLANSLGAGVVNYGKMLIPGYAGRARPGGGTFASGGYTGDGAKYAPAGLVHRGEYVMPKRVVQNIGVSRMAHIHKSGLSRRGYASGGLVGGSAPRGGSGAGGMSVVGLDAATIHALVNGISTQISLDGRAIGQSVSRGFARNNALGGS